jgi:hypothetical protein
MWRVSTQKFVLQLRQKGTPLDVEELLKEATVAEHHLKNIREALEEQGALRAVKQQVAQGQVDFEQMVDKKILVEPSEFVRDMHWTRQALSKALCVFQRSWTPVSV